MEADDAVEAPPRALYRWLGVAPLFAMFTILTLALPRAVSMMRALSTLRVELRVELPPPSRPAFALTQALSEYYWFFAFAVCALACFYFAWVAKEKQRIFWFNIAVVASLAFAMFLFSTGIYAPFNKLVEALRKK